MINLLCGPTVVGLQDPCDLSFPCRLCAEQSLLSYFADLGGPALRYPEWRWLLHTRRVPVLPDADVSQLGASVVGEKFATLPKCAGIGDPAGIVWTCWPCLVDLCCKKPRLPVDGLVNDNWIGREWVTVRETTEATRTLLSLGRPCWKQVRLGKGKPDVQQTGVRGNTIFFAQPTADVPSMELPPPTDALIDSFNIIVTRTVQDLRYATWAVVKREEYLTIARRRQKECPVFAHAIVQEEEAKTRLPQDGVPEHLRKCVQYVQGASKAPVRMSGPAARAPDVGNNEEAGEESDRSDGPCPFTGALQQSTLTSMVPCHRWRSLLSVKNLPDDHRLPVEPLAC